MVDVPGQRAYDPQATARAIRGHALRMSHRAGTPHLGSSLSCVEILAAAYGRVLSVDPANPAGPDRDRFILSKGHAISALYATLAVHGFFPETLLETFNAPGGRLPEQPSPGCVPGLEWATGSLGHGLSVGLGMALAARLQGRAGRVIVVLSDGECEEGSVWEAALFAAAHRLDRVAVVVDYNKWQATARSDETMALGALHRKWEAFGWSACEVDGHDLEALGRALGNLPDGSGRPVAVVAHTVKGRGVSFMEDDNNWHYRSPDAAELERALRELGLT